ncbi:hypothetical protein HUU51_01340 [Candidatus Gracilibacteria bacterium]|nr:hypothetical protein [Candidatus Gracilibacteria bacterium]
MSEKIDLGFEKESAYQVFPFLDDYGDHIKDPEVIGEGNYGVVVDGGYERIYKLGKNKDFSDALRREYNDHCKFYLGYEKIKSKPENENNPKYAKLRIPEVLINPRLIQGKNSKEELFIYEMEKIHGHNLLSYLIREELQKINIVVNLDDYSDREMELLYSQHIGKSIDLLRNGVFMDLTNEDRKFMKSVGNGVIKGVGNSFPSLLFKKYFPELYEEISEILFELKKAGYKHTDLHAKNLMISFDKNGNPIVYLIDFGIVDIKKGL